MPKTCQSSDINWLQHELNRSHFNETKLQAQIKEYEKRLSHLTEVSLKKEQEEVARLKQEIQRKESYAKTQATLRRKAVFLQEKAENTRSSLISQCQEKARICRELEGKYSKEKRLREQKEKEVEHLFPLREEIEKLKTENLRLKRLTYKLKAERNQAVKEMEQQEELIEKEHKKAQEALQDKDNMKEKLWLCADECRALDEKLCSLNVAHEKLKDDFYVCQKQAKEDKRELNRLTAETKAKEEKRSEIRTIDKMSHFIAQRDKEIQNLRKELKSKTEELESKAKDFERYRVMVLRMQDLVRTDKQLKCKLQEEMNQLSKTKNEKITQLNDTLSDQQNEHRKVLIKKEALQAEKYLCSEDLLKTKQKLSESAETIRTLKKDIEIKNHQLEKKTAEFANIQSKCLSLMRKLEAVTKDLEETKTKLDRHLASAEKDRNTVQKCLAIAKNRKLDQELQRYKDTVLQLQEKIKRLEDANDAQEKKIREQEKDGTFTMLEIQGLRDNLIIKDRHLEEWFEGKGRASYQDWWKTRKERLYLDCNHEQQLEEKDKEIERLKRELEQRPVDVALKLHQSQWENRDLKRKLQAARGQLIAHEEECILFNDEKKLRTSRAKSKPKISLPPSTKVQFKPGCSSESQWFASSPTLPLLSFKGKCVSGFQATPPRKQHAKIVFNL